MTVQTADKLPLNKPARIASLSPTALSVKLMQMGCLPGKNITVLRKAIGNNPVYIRIESLNLALRSEEAAQIFVDTKTGQ